MAIFSNRRRCHLGVAGYFGASKTLALGISGGFNSGAHFLRFFTLAVIRQFLIFDMGHFYKNIDPVDKRSADAVLVAGYLAGRTGTGMIGISEISARTSVKKKTAPQ